MGKEFIKPGVEIPDPISIISQPVPGNGKNMRIGINGCYQNVGGAAQKIFTVPPFTKGCINEKFRMFSRFKEIIDLIT